MTEERTPFLSRWSQRKVQVRQGAAMADLPPLPQPAVEVAAILARAEPAEPPKDVAPQDGTPPTEPPPTLFEASQLTPASDFSRFVKNNVSPEVKNTALKQLFADPHFNVMDRLDTYIDDYNTPDPLPASWLRKMTQSAALGLFDDEEKDAKAQAIAFATARSIADLTDETAVTKRKKELNKALQTPAVAQKLNEQGIDVVGGGPEALDKFLRTEITRWAAVVKDNGIKAGD